MKSNKPPSTKQQNNNNNSVKVFKPYIPCINGTKCKHYAKGTCTFLHNFQGNNKKQNNNNGSKNNYTVKKTVIKAKQQNKEMEDDTDYLNKKKIDILGENQENNNNESITNSDKIDEAKTESTADSLTMGEWDEDHSQEKESPQKSENSNNTITNTANILPSSLSKSNKKSKKLRLDSNKNLDFHYQQDNSLPLNIKTNKQNNNNQISNIKFEDNEHNGIGSTGMTTPEKLKNIFSQKEASKQQQSQYKIDINVKDLQQEEFSVNSLLFKEIWQLN